MRTYGRVRNPVTQEFVPDPVTGMIWRVVETDDNGFNDEVYLTTLCQVLQLNLNESPFYADWGIPAQPTIVQQVQPDFYISRIQSRFAQYFAALLIAKTESNPPTYKVNVTTNQGARIVVEVPQ